MIPTAEERFHSRYIAEPNSGCWLWVYGTNKAGYGALSVSGKSVRAARFSYELHKGPIPPRLLVRHICDNRPCVNPDHLILGTYKDNTADMVRRGRATRFMSEIAFCPTNHKYTPENTYRNPNTGHRSCRTCKRAHNSRYKNA